MEGLGNLICETTLLYDLVNQAFIAFIDKLFGLLKSNSLPGFSQRCINGNVSEGVHTDTVCFIALLWLCVIEVQVVNDSCAVENFRIFVQKHA